MSSVSQSTIPTLHHLSSSQSLRVLWALEELKQANGTQYNLQTYKRVGGRAPDSLKQIHPLGKSPTLTVAPISSSEPSETKTLIETRLIFLFIANNYANGLWTPSSASSVERDLFFQEYANSTLRSNIDFTVVFSIIPSQLPFPLKPVGSVLCAPIVSLFKKGLVPVFQLLEDALSDELPWFSGERIGLADFNVSWGVDVAVARRFIEKGKFPKVEEWHRRVTGREAYKRALEVGGEYDLVKF